MEISALASAGDGGALEQVFTNSNFPGIILLTTSGIVGMIFIMRWLVRFQREFTQFYIEENQKLRLQVNELRQEVDKKEEEISSARQELTEHRRESMYKLSDCEIRLAAQEDHIKRLNGIIERRKLEREE